MESKLNFVNRVKNKIHDILGLGINRYLKDISGVIHVGANTGQERDLYERHNLQVLWIEPIPSVFEKLKNNISDYERQNAVKALITDVNNKEYNFNIANNDGASSSILDFSEHKEIWPDVHYEETLLLTSTTLEKLIKDERIDMNKYQALVLDTQGSELLVLKGSKSLLKYFKYISTEAADFESYENGCTLSEINEYLNDNGFIEISKRKFAESRAHGSYYNVLYRREN